MEPRSGDRLRILTWHVHGSYLWYLAHARHEFFVPVKPDRPPGYAGVAGTFPWPSNIHEVPADEVAGLDIDVVLTQSNQNWIFDRHEILSGRQRTLPRVHLEHDPPRESPTDSKHIVDDREALLVHVTHFNELMWDSGKTPSRVIEHGVRVPETVRYSGHLPKGLVVVNCIGRRGRRLGADIYTTMRERVPLDLIGMEAEESGGLGEIKPPGMAEFAVQYRFLFNPIRYTSLGLAVCEAMMAGIPVVGLATTEMVTTISNGVSGWVDTDLEALARVMNRLIKDEELARRWGEGARRTALERFSLDRFAGEWDQTFRQAVGAGFRSFEPASFRTAGEAAAGSGAQEGSRPGHITSLPNSVRS